MKSVHVAALSAALAFALIAPAFAEEAAKDASKPDVAKGAQISQQVCGACHTADGSRGVPQNPILQGQHAQYLVKQLTEFKAGKRDNPIMKGRASSLSEADMQNVAAFYESKQAKPGAAKHKDTVELGQSIWRAGIAAKGVPACAGCHSPNGAGIPAQYPRLAGQHSDYVVAQLAAFSQGKRANSAQMAAIAVKLNDAEMQAVADYAAGLH